MASRISWVGVGVGAVVGAIVRVAVAAAHFPAILGELYGVALLAAMVGVVTGGVAGATGRALLGTVVGAGLSIVFYLGSLPLAGLATFLGSGTAPAFWEVVVVGAIPGAIGGWAGQLAAKRREAAGAGG